jgi:hypothetical protein
MLFTAPLFLLFPYGYLVMKRHGHRLLGLTVVISALFYLLFVFSAHVWHGGWGFGSRLMVPALVLAALPVAWAVERLSRNGIAMGAMCGMVVFAMGYHQVVHLVYQEPPDFSLNPLLDIVIPAATRGIVSPNLAYVVTGRPGLWTIVPALAMVGCVSGFVVSQGLFALRGRGRRLLFGAGVLLIVAALTAPIFLLGPSFSKLKTRDFVRSMERTAKAEYGDRFEPRDID